jgi:energy-coupling factor transport system ATP-binding protein
MEEIVNADRIFIMENGHIIMEGSPREIFNRPEELQKMRLNVPEVVEIAQGLKKAGLDISTDILTAEEL